MKLVIYARYSSHSQTEQSIEGQLQVCYEFAKSNGHTVVGEYIDRAQSGTSDNRTDFQRMIADRIKARTGNSFGYGIVFNYSCNLYLSVCVDFYTAGTYTVSGYSYSGYLFYIYKTTFI